MFRSFKAIFGRRFTTIRNDSMSDDSSDTPSNEPTVLNDDYRQDTEKKAKKTSKFMNKLRTLFKGKKSSRPSTMDPADKEDLQVSSNQAGNSIAQPDEDLTLIKPEDSYPDKALPQDSVHSHVNSAVDESKKDDASEEDGSDQIPPFGNPLAEISKSKKWYFQIAWEMCTDSKLRKGQYLKNKNALEKAQKFKNRYVIITPFFGFGSKNFNKTLWTTCRVPTKNPVSCAVKEMHANGYQLMMGRLRSPGKPLVVFLDVLHVNPHVIDRFIGGAKRDDLGHVNVTNPKWRRHIFAFNYLLSRFFSFLNPELRRTRLANRINRPVNTLALKKTSDLNVQASTKDNYDEEEWDDVSDDEGDFVVGDYGEEEWEDDDDTEDSTQ